MHFKIVNPAEQPSILKDGFEWPFHESDAVISNRQIFRSDIQFIDEGIIFPVNTTDKLAKRRVQWPDACA